MGIDLCEAKILSGVKPTGAPHLGNLIGAINPIISSSHEARVSYVFIADLHALNAIKDKSALKNSTYEIAATFLALGLNLDRALLFRQSDVPETMQMSSLLMNVTPKGLLNKAHAYKAIVEKNQALAVDIDAGVNMGLFTYPILMAADILLYQVDFVPVGQDQKQHIEFARDIASSFNYTYKGELLKLPVPMIAEGGGVVPGFDGRKMSKSYQNTIPIFSDEATLYKNIMRIKTDSKLPEDIKDPGESTIIQLYKHFSTKENFDRMEKSFMSGGVRYGEAKLELFEAINGRLKEARNKYDYLLNHKDELELVLRRCAEQARAVARETLSIVKQEMLG